MQCTFCCNDTHMCIDIYSSFIVYYINNNTHILFVSIVETIVIERKETACLVFTSQRCTVPAQAAAFAKPSLAGMFIFFSQEYNMNFYIQFFHPTCFFLAPDLPIAKNTRMTLSSVFYCRRSAPVKYAMPVCF